MASASRRNPGTVRELLYSEPYRFDFFQAVRVLEWMSRRGSKTGPESAARPVGQDSSPEEEVVRFRAQTSLSFPPGPIAGFGDAQQIEGSPGQSEAGRGNKGAAPPEMSVSFLGLIGPSGVLPQHYTRMVLDRVRAKDFALRDFLDLFNHRITSLFYRAWEKERFAVGYERCKADLAGREEDLFTRALYCLVGLGTAGLRERTDVGDAALIYYAGHFSHHPRSALGLKQILGDYFGHVFEVQQFQGQWLYLNNEDRSLLPSRQHPKGQNSMLGMGLVVGERVWDVQSRFRLTVGPLRYREFCGFMPDGDILKGLVQMTRLYVGAELDFDVQPVLRADEVPACRLGGDAGFEPKLGWNTWLVSRPLEKDASEAVFFLEDV